MSVDVNVPDAAGLTIAQRAQAIIASLQQWATNHNNDAVKAFNDALKNAADNSFVPAPMLWTVDGALVLALMSGEDAVIDDWNKVFVQTPYLPPPPPSPVAQIVVISSVPGVLPGGFEAQSGDSPSVPDGKIVVQDGVAYVKFKVPGATTPFSPYPDKSIHEWKPLSL